MTDPEKMQHRDRSMSHGNRNAGDRKMTSLFERYLTLWVALCIAGGILLGKVAPGLAIALDRMAIEVGNAPVVSIPIAICLFFMMYPIMVKIDFTEVVRAGRSGKPVFLTLFFNWAVKPFTMYGIAVLFLGLHLRGFIGEEATDLVKMPFGLDLPLGATHGAGTVVLHEGSRCWRFPCGGATWRGAHCSVSLPARPWSSCEGTWPGGMTA